MDDLKKFSEPELENVEGNGDSKILCTFYGAALAKAGDELVKRHDNSAYHMIAILLRIWN